MDIQGANLQHKEQRQFLILANKELFCCLVKARFHGSSGCIILCQLLYRKQLRGQRTVLLNTAAKY